MYLPILRMSCHVLGLLLATVLCWNLCQGEIKFHSDDVMCSQNETTKKASIQKAVSVIFCVTVGPQDVLHNDVRIRSSNQSYLEGTLYRLNYTDSRPQVSSLTKASYTTINITFTKLETGDFNEKLFVAIFGKSGTKLEEKVLVWFILEQETESANETSTSVTHGTTDHGDTTSSVAAEGTDQTNTSDKPAATSTSETETSDGNSPHPENNDHTMLQEKMNYIYIAISLVIVIIIAVIISLVMYRYRGRFLKTSRASDDADDVNAYAEVSEAMINSGHGGHGKGGLSAGKKESRDEKSVNGKNSSDHLMSAHVDDKDTGRNISEQGLVYVTVAQTTKQDKKKSEQASDKKKKPQQTKQGPVVEPVEYTKVDFGKSGNDTGRNISEQGLVYLTVAQATKEDKKKSEQASDKKKKPQQTTQESVVEPVEYTTVNFGENI